MGEDGFEPSKSYAADLQSVPFGHSGNPPYSIPAWCLYGAGRRTRTPDLLITNQLLYQLSYTSISNSRTYIIRILSNCQHLFFLDKFLGLWYIIKALCCAGIAQLVEQLICNQQVGGSSPSTSSTTILYGRFPEWPKGTDCKSVVYDFGGSNPPPPTS